VLEVLLTYKLLGLQLPRVVPSQPVAAQHAIQQPGSCYSSKSSDSDPSGAVGPLVRPCTFVLPALFRASGLGNDAGMKAVLVCGSCWGRQRFVCVMDVIVRPFARRTVSKHLGAACVRMWCLCLCWLLGRCHG